MSATAPKAAVETAKGSETPKVQKSGPKSSGKDENIPATPASSPKAVGQAQYGRRAGASKLGQRDKDQDGKKGSTDNTDAEINDMETLGEDASEADVRRAAAEAQKRAQDQEEKLRLQVAAAPVEYHSVMPKLANLDTAGRWSKFFQHINNEFDMTCLTTCLASELDDEDVQWNPELLLVQLTSEFRSEGGTRGDVAESSVSSTGGDRRMRKSRRLTVEDETAGNKPAAGKEASKAADDEDSSAPPTSNRRRRSSAKDDKNGGANDGEKPATLRETAFAEKDTGAKPKPKVDAKPKPLAVESTEMGVAAKSTAASNTPKKKWTDSIAKKISNVKKSGSKSKLKDGEGSMSSPPKKSI